MTGVCLLVTCLAGADPQTVLLDFASTRCVPCQQMSPYVAKLERQGLPVHRIDCDQNPNLVRAYNIQSIPAFVLVIRGQEVGRVVGARPEQVDLLVSRLKTELAKQAAPPPAEKVAVAEEPWRPAAPAAPANKRVLPIFRPKPAPRLDVVRGNLNQSSEILTVPYTGPMSASVRIRVSDGRATNFGSGTIIDSRLGQTLILTCGHVVRDLPSDAKIEIDLWTKEGRVTVLGTSLASDQQADLGLIAIPTDDLLPSAPLATAALKKGEALQSVGCGGGTEPVLQKHQITALNRYRGPDNVECSGVPQQGRSGGGLFNTAGELVGVCSAADPQEQRGLYCGPKAIVAFLLQQKLGRLYDNPPAEIAEPDAPLVAEDEPAAAEPSGEQSEQEEAVEEINDPLLAGEDAGEETPAEPARQPAAPVRFASASNETESFADLADDEDLEVVCVIRSRKAPDAGNRVIVLNRASPEFVDFLTASAARSEGQPVSAVLPPPGSRSKAGLRTTSLAQIFAEDPPPVRRGANSRVRNFTSGR